MRSSQSWTKGSWMTPSRGGTPTIMTGAEDHDVRALHVTRDADDVDRGGERLEERAVVVADPLRNREDVRHRGDDELGHPAGLHPGGVATDPLEGLARVGAARLAVHARPALDVRLHHHTLSGLEVDDPRTALVHDPHEFVTGVVRRLEQWVVPGDGVRVRPADPRERDRHPNLPLPGDWDRGIDDRDVVQPGDEDLPHRGGVHEFTP